MIVRSSKYKTARTTVEILNRGCLNFSTKEVKTMKKIVSLSAVTLFGFSITFAACKDKEPAPLPPPLAPSIPNPATPLKPGEITPPPAKSPDKKDLS